MCIHGKGGQTQTGSTDCVTWMDLRGQRGGGQFKNCSSWQARGTVIINSFRCCLFRGVISPWKLLVSMSEQNVVMVNMLQAANN